MLGDFLKGAANLYKGLGFSAQGLKATVSRTLNSSIKRLGFRV